MNKSFLPYGRQSIGAADRRAVLRALRAPHLTQGPAVARFEEAFAKKVGAPYAVAVSSGTAALHLACLAAGYGPKDTIVTSPVTFVATANCALYAGANVRFADIEPESWSVDPEALGNDRRPMRGVHVVHLAGKPARALIRRASAPTQQAGPVWIEDACHALGARYRVGTKWFNVGSGHHSEMTVFSFHPVKHITTGEGGMITTRDAALYAKLVTLRAHGIVKDPAHFEDAAQKNNPWYYEMQDLGFNYRLTDFQCELGLSQLRQLDGWVARRRELAAFYSKNLKRLPFTAVPTEESDVRSSYHLYVLGIDFGLAGFSRAEAMRRLAEQGIGTQVHYIPIYRQPYYQKRFGFSPADYPASERYYDRALSIPLHQTMRLSDARRVVRSLESLFLKRHVAQR